MLVSHSRLCTITKYSHFFSVTNIDPILHKHLMDFCLQFVIRTLTRVDPKKPPVMKITTIFASRLKNMSEYRFHIGQLNLLLNFLKYRYIEIELIELIEKPLYPLITINNKLKDGWVLREEQQEAEQFVLQSSPDDNNSRLLYMPTGTGKTVTGLSAASKYKNRVLIFILAKYVDKWISDVKQIIDIKDKEILTIQGSDNLRSSIFLAKDNQFNYNYIIITLDTMANFIKSYENNYYECLDMYGIDPSELCELFNIGVVLVDEAHQHLFKVFKTLSFVHAPKVIALSGTFLSNDPMIDRMQSIMFPKEMRFSKIKMKKYIKTLCVSYQIKEYNKSKIRTSEFRSSTYSHTAFEKSLIRNHVKLKTYFNMIKDLVNSIYIKDYIKGDKVLIFCSTKILCRKLKDYLMSMLRGYDIRTYIEEDPYENIIQADISISTLGSAGTALDIPNLRVVINTVNVDSITTNLQALGRLRELKDRDVKYCYIYCSGIPKHVKYHERRKELFKNSVLCLSDLHYPQPI